jgi:ribosomal protein L40E
MFSVDYSMNGRYSDFEELRPTGEASHVPDTRLDDGYEGDPRRQRVATSAGGYPDAPTTTDGECRSCGASVPDGQTKCRFCLTNHLGSDATSTDETASTTFLGIVHLVVESTTFYGAVAKGGATANLLSANEAEPAVDDYTLIYDLDEAPARQLAEQWPSLPDAVQVSSAEGERLLSAARDRTGWHGQEASERQEQGPTRLYDQRGDGIRDASGLDAVLDDAADAVWLVPAMALTESTGEAAADRQVSSVPTTQELDCRNCGRATDHRFKTHESIPDEAWTGQPIWECQVCGAARYGPSLE